MARKVVNNNQNKIKELWQGSSAGESARLIPVRSRVRISPLLFFYINLEALKGEITNEPYVDLKNSFNKVLEKN